MTSYGSDKLIQKKLGLENKKMMKKQEKMITKI